MNKQEACDFREELRDILISHFSSPITDVEEIVGNLLDDISVKVINLPHISVGECEDCDSDWRDKISQQSEFYADQINERNAELSSANSKILELKQVIADDSVNKILETKLATVKKQNIILRKIVRDLLEGFN